MLVEIVSEVCPASNIRTVRLGFRHRETGGYAWHFGRRLLLHPAISGTLQPEPFEVEMMAKSHADAGRRGSGVSVGREG